MRLGVVVALPVEARCLLGTKVKPGERINLNRTSQGLVGWVQVSGMGPQNARHAAESLLAAGATALISWGMAAGIDPELRPGNLVLPKTVIAADGRLFTADIPWHQQIVSTLSSHMKVHTNNLAETATALTSTAEKNGLFLHSHAVAADMESAAVGSAAQQAGIPFLVIRTIVDDAATSLPAAAVIAMDMSGNFHLRRWIKSILQHPAQIADMLPLALGFRAACATLTSVAALVKHELLPFPNSQQPATTVQAPSL